jgi:hypothetical protein
LQEIKKNIASTINVVPIRNDKSELVSSMPAHQFGDDLLESEDQSWFNVKFIACVVECSLRCLRILSGVHLLQIEHRCATVLISEAICIILTFHVDFRSSIAFLSFTLQIVISNHARHKADTYDFRRAKMKAAYFQQLIRRL